MTPTTRALAALGAALASQATHAALSPLDSTPTNDHLDTATGLVWYQASSLAEGEALGFRWATAAQALALPASSLMEPWVFALGGDSSSNFGQPAVGVQVDVRTFITQVANEQGQTVLAGFKNWYFQDPPMGPGLFRSWAMVGTAGQFAPVWQPVAPGGYNAPWSYTLNADGQTTLTCDYECYAQMPGGIWGHYLDQHPADTLGYLMVRSSAVPEPASGAMLALGLIGLLALGARRAGGH